ncbi:hypothetical protein M405DRAFT_932573 [Rhizopogon salebrosus TDB-379]|nr:hypothetical protein M405DRAFT_932573 [Rhizopogon salebrosus TDB-379]
MEVSQGTDNTLSPINPEPHINRLPVEFLQTIFLLIVYNVPDYPSIFLLKYGATLVTSQTGRSFLPDTAEYTISANFAAPPLLFTRVCHLWRIVAESTPRVWSRIQIMLPSGSTPLRLFLPSLLRVWLARSGDQPLTICVDTRPLVIQCGTRFQLPDPAAGSQIIEILLSERGRWETMNFASGHYEWKVKLKTLDTPQLVTLECDISDLQKFNAPNLSHLRIRGFSYISTIPSGPTITTANIRHLHLNHTSVHFVHSVAMIFPHLQTLVVDRIFPGFERDPGTRSCLEIRSMTLPIFPHIDDTQLRFVAIFRALHLPVLQKLVLVGEPGEIQVENVMAALVVASCHLRVIDFQPEKARPLSKVDAGVAEPLLSVVEEVTVCGELLCHRVLRN